MLFILFYISIEFSMLLYSFLVISFALHKEYINGPISFSKFLDATLAFIYSGAIGNF